MSVGPQPCERARGAAFESQAPRRGLVRALELTLSTRAPYHLVEHRLRIDVPLDLAVYPELARVRQPESLGRSVGALEQHRPGDSGGLRNLRPYQPGDELRRVHWRSSARSGSLMLRELNAEEHASVVVELAAPSDPLAFEQALSEAASAVRDGLVRGLRVELVGPLGKPVWQGPRELAGALRWFASLAPRSAVEAAR